MKKSILSLFIIVLFFSCEKKEQMIKEIVSNDAMEQRSNLVEKGYTEVEVNPIIKESCYFEKWDKTVETPVSGLFEYYDENDNWVASIDFGDGACDEWATKTWSVNIFPEHPEGSENFSVFKIKYDYKK